jgi:hypothetical protein
MANIGRSRRLTFEQAEEIRRRRTAGERGTDLAAEYGVAVQTVCDIWHRRRYARPTADESCRALSAALFEASLTLTRKGQHVAAERARQALTIFGGRS